MKGFFILVVMIFIVIHKGFSLSNETYYRSYKCEAGKCSRTFHPLEIPPALYLQNNLSVNDIEHSTISACRLSCDFYGGLWPVPTGLIELGYKYVAIHPSLFSFDLLFVRKKFNEIIDENEKEKAENFIRKINSNFILNLEGFLKKNYQQSEQSDESYQSINVVIVLNSTDLTLDWSTDESYALDLNVDDKSGNTGRVEISANTVYGVRHGMETLLQLTSPIIKTGGHRGLVILKSAKITDAPIFAHRGLSLDTSRNFVSVDNILKTIDGLSSSKMNILHWHATDSQSFPIEIKRVPSMNLYGAYSPEKIYKTSDMEFIVSYGKLRGVRVIIELDAPSHSGAGWEWGEEAGLGSLAVCVNSQPWRYFCIQPPCGQLNPVNPNLYNILRRIYKDLMDVWGSKEVFHMGGDEVFIPCWNSTKEITDFMINRGMQELTQNDFLQIWSDYQSNLLKILDEERKLRGFTNNVSAILWSSELTNPLTIQKYLDKNRYVIQTWVESSSNLPNQLLDLGYRVIFTTKNAWYLDHGFWGNTKYYTWRNVYLNRIPQKPGVLGGEVASWGEYVDSESLDPRIWPRTAAVAERLWSDPPTLSTAQAESRFYSQIQRLIARDISPDSIAPEWCAQHDGQCQ